MFIYIGSQPPRRCVASVYIFCILWDSPANNLTVRACVCYCVLCVCGATGSANAARVIIEVPHIESEEVEMDKHSTSSSRGSSQWVSQMAACPQDIWACVCVCAFVLHAHKLSLELFSVHIGGLICFLAELWEDTIMCDIICVDYACVHLFSKGNNQAIYDFLKTYLDKVVTTFWQDIELYVYYVFAK